MRELPDLSRLHERHRGLTPGLCRAYSEAAAVCLARHHTSPTKLSVYMGDSSYERSVQWLEPTASQLSAWANEIDTTEAGAYGLAIASIESILGFVALARARTYSGADYYIGRSHETDLQQAFRLEISGVNAGSHLVVTERLRRKIRQVRRAGNAPAFACVVGFESGIIMVAAC